MKLWSGDDLAATLAWDDTGLTKASIEDGPSTTFDRDDEHRPVSVEVDDDRVDWTYKAGRSPGRRRRPSDLLRLPQGRLHRTTLDDGDEESTIIWDPSHARPEKIDTPDGQATFEYSDSKVTSIRIDGEDQPVRYQDDEPTRRATPATSSTLCSTTPASTGALLVSPRWDPQPRGSHPSPVSSASRCPKWSPVARSSRPPSTASSRRCRASSSDDPRTSRNDRLRSRHSHRGTRRSRPGPGRPSGPGSRCKDLELDFAGAVDAATAGPGTEILGPGPGLVESVVDFGQDLVEWCHDRRRAPSHPRFVTQDPSAASS